MPRLPTVLLWATLSLLIVNGCIDRSAGRPVVEFESPSDGQLVLTRRPGDIEGGSVEHTREFGDMSHEELSAGSIERQPLFPRRLRFNDPAAGSTETPIHGRDRLYTPEAGSVVSPGIDNPFR